MLSDSYQGGASIELFSPHGRDPMAACKVTNGAAGVRKEFDKHVRGFVVVCDGGPKTKLQFPIDEKKGCTHWAFEYACFVWHLLYFHLH